MVRHWTPKPVIISCTRSSPTRGNFFLLLLNPLNTKLPFLPTLYKLWKTRVVKSVQKEVAGTPGQLIALSAFNTLKEALSLSGEWSAMNLPANTAEKFPFPWQVKINQFEIIYKPAFGVRLISISFGPSIISFHSSFSRQYDNDVNVSKCELKRYFSIFCEQFNPHLHETKMCT